MDFKAQVRSQQGSSPNKAYPKSQKKTVSFVLLATFLLP